MRLLFLFLLLVNGAVYLWYTTQGNQANATVPPLPANVPILELLAEQPPQANTTASNQMNTGSEEDDSNLQAETVLHCYTLGPFMNRDSVNAAADKMMISGRTFERRASERKEQYGYWIYLPPYENMAAAQAVAQELKLLGDKHYYIVQPPNENAYAISLGVFRDRRNADRRYETIKNMGYDVKLEARFRQNPVFWLDYSEEESAEPLDLKEFVGVQRLPRGCEQIASGGELP